MRARTVSGVLVAWSLLAQAALAQQTLGIKEIVQRESPAIVSVYNVDAKGDLAGTGTGFIVKPDGVLITNFHVIDGAQALVIKLKNGEAYDRVWVLDFDPRRDIAILKIEGVQMPTVRLGDSERIEQGDWCVAIGNPQGLEHTVSDGLVSAIRVMEGSKTFQISVPISPGSSGGPLYNSRGEVIAITSAGLVGEGVQNLNFAVPLKYALPMLESTTRMTIAEAAATFWPARPAEGAAAAPRASAYSDASGIATITVEPGWSAGPPNVQGAVMSVTRGASNLQIMFLAGFRDVDRLFQIGQSSVESSLKKFKADSVLSQSEVGGNAVMMQYFSGEAQDIKIRAFVGALVTPKGGFMAIAVMPGGNPVDSDAVRRMFMSLR